MLSSVDHQVLYGRRGTGKTHVLYYLADEVRRAGDLPIYVDMRTVGSTGGIYGDPNVSITERGTRLLLDTLGAVQNILVDYALTLQYEVGNAIQALTLLDRLADEVAASVRVVGAVATDDAESSSTSSTSSNSLALLASTTPSLKVEAGSQERGEHRAERRTHREGVELHSVHFGAITTLVRDIIPALGLRRMWLLFDEWSSVPLDLQPLLADLLRRSLFPVQGITVKIGAIEQRSEFIIGKASSDHLGIELGADAVDRVPVN